MKVRPHLHSNGEERTQPRVFEEVKVFVLVSQRNVDLSFRLTFLLALLLFSPSFFRLFHQKFSHHTVLG